MPLCLEFVAEGLRFSLELFRVSGCGQIRTECRVCGSVQFESLEQRICLAPTALFIVSSPRRDSVNAKLSALKARFIPARSGVRLTANR